MAKTKEVNGDEPRHPIQVVARRTGISADLIRMWEKRYRVVRPGRTSGGRRAYTDADVEKLRLLREATLGGRRISDVAGLSIPELRAMILEDVTTTAARPPSPAGARVPGAGGDPPGLPRRGSLHGRRPPAGPGDAHLELAPARRAGGGSPRPSLPPHRGGVGGGRARGLPGAPRHLGHPDGAHARPLDPTIGGSRHRSLHPQRAVPRDRADVRGHGRRQCGLAGGVSGTGPPGGGDRQGGPSGEGAGGGDQPGRFRQNPRNSRPSFSDWGISCPRSRSSWWGERAGTPNGKRWHGSGRSPCPTSASSVRSSTGRRPRRIVPERLRSIPGGHGVHRSRGSTGSGRLTDLRAIPPGSATRLQAPRRARCAGPRSLPGRPRWAGSPSR